MIWYNMTTIDNHLSCQVVNLSDGLNETKHFNGDVRIDSSKEVWKLNFRQYGEMEMAQPGRNSDVEKVRREKIRDGESQKRCRCAKR